MKNNNNDLMKFCLSFPFSTRTMSCKGEDICFTASPAQCKALAENHGLIEVSSFSARYHFMKSLQGEVKVTGFFEADIIQRCIITLAPLPKYLKEKVEVVFVPSSFVEKDNSAFKEEDIFYDANYQDPPEVYDGYHIDVGPITEELFELSLDLYPRQKDAEPLEFSTEKKGDIKKSPFAVLKNYTKK